MNTSLRLRLLENLHLPLWLIKDTCWAMVWKPLGIFMIVPTLALSFYITWKTKNHQQEFLPNLSVSFWILANSIWMCDEFYDLDILHLSLIAFTSGFLTICFWILKYFTSLWNKSN